jgi:ubiquinone biosynthesis protein
VAEKTVEAALGRPVAEVYGSFEPEPITSGSMARVHRATLLDGTPVAVKVLHEGADLGLRDVLALMQAVAAWLEDQDPECSRPIWRC